MDDTCPSLLIKSNVLASIICLNDELYPLITFIAHLNSQKQRPSPDCYFLLYKINIHTIVSAIISIGDGR